MFGCVLFLKIDFILVYVCVSFYAPFVRVCRYPQRPEEGVGSHVIGITNSYELACKCWELNPGPLEEHPVLLTTEPSLQPEGLFK